MPLPCCCSPQWVGAPCGSHGPYVFYRAFRFQRRGGGRARVLSLGDFFFVRCRAEEPACIAELQLLWEERTSRQLLSSAKLYFLPEDTPQGRTSDHGEDEVIAVSEKVTVKLEDLAKWAQSDFSKWKCGFRAEPVKPMDVGKNGQKEALMRYRQSTLNSGLNFKDILKEKADLGEDDEDSNLLILSYPQYCRYRSMLKRVQDKPSSILTDQFVLALGGIAVTSKNPQIFYCRDTFDHPTLIENESICDEFAPNLKGRPRKKKPCPQRRDSLNGIKDSNNNSESKAVAKITARRQWKHIYDELGGNPGSTSAATCTRRHYERLILPYERFIKGEEDKPLPPVKPRKQDNSSQEGEAKTKVSGTKRIKNENQKNKKEKDNAQKPQDASEVSSEQEKDQESTDQKNFPEHATVGEMKQPVQGPPSLLPETARPLPLEKADLSENSMNSEKAKEEVQHSSSFSSVSMSPEEDTMLDATITKRLHPPADALEETKPEQRLHKAFPDSLESEPPDMPFTAFPVQLTTQSDMEDDKLPEMADYIANCTVKVDQLGNEDIHNALKQTPKVLVVQNFDMFKEKELPGSMNDDSTFGYTPLLYSKGNPGIMSPLAKKKLLSQVSGAALSCSYPYGSPPPLISKKKLNSRDELSSSISQGPHAPNSDPVAINRPSVIQHVQSFKTKEERKSINDVFKHDMLSKPDPQRCDFAKHHLSSLAESYVPKMDIQDCKDKMSEKRALQHSHVPTFLADFYSSPHLHSLYRHTEHHLNNEQTSKYLPRDMFRESENTSTFTQHKHHEKLNLNYRPSLHQQEKKAAVEASSDDQPTDLSLPKSIHKQTAKAPGSSLPHSSMAQQEGKGISPFQAASSQAVSLDCNPKACRVSPMAMTAPKKHSELLHRSGKQQAQRLENLRKMEGMVHPIISRRTSPQNVGAARPLKRSLEDLDKVISEKKIRAVSPLHLPKETPAKDKVPDPEGEGSKPVHGLHSGSMLESHKFPLSAPIFPGLYPGSLCTGLNNRLPPGYSHPLQYLKNQTVLSPLMQPLALHSFMVQRQFLTSPANSQQLYRHLAAATPVGSSYGDLLHNSIYPLAAINPQAAFPPSQLSSVHPSTKL
ncbi:AT-rich interactive domain-containing protein 5B isoform X3 [Falco biarmicus]|uniref:AT-rich interactive domain-containing protein 5B n=1 Tax=Falco rusticolus TaxID=120794 RepID=UPI00188664F0|nr:AT-rich interactive domain-containing protein 5B [Falco rusticolus]XP_055575608.1 AT-rich interactive domain-containing protein 5B isoform X3 [Falco cherrug]XP_055656021.1 AT-rich interactive domain-containing protein 5B isoform X3 [Falco peregrinus]XP_056206720.1 AT-rich interactive domain-containing protein 5B isoform X3 [Falco biarmicus]